MWRRVSCGRCEARDWDDQQPGSGCPGQCRRLLRWQRHSDDCLPVERGPFDQVDTVGEMQSVTTHPAPTVTSSQSTDRSRRADGCTLLRRPRGTAGCVLSAATHARSSGSRPWCRCRESVPRCDAPRPVGGWLAACHRCPRSTRPGRRPSASSNTEASAIWTPTKCAGVSRIAGSGEPPHPSISVREDTAVAPRRRVRCDGERHPGVPGEMGV